MKHVKLFETFINEGVGASFENIIKGLKPAEKDELIRLSENVVDRAKKAGMTLYVNLRSYRWGDAIEFCIKHNHDNVENSREHKFLQEFKYKVDRGVKITPKLVFEITTGSWDGPWDEDTISVDTFFKIIR